MPKSPPQQDPKRERGFDFSRDLNDAQRERWLHSDEKRDPDGWDVSWAQISLWTRVVVLVFALVGLYYLGACAAQHVWPFVGTLPSPIVHMTPNPSPTGGPSPVPTTP